jgi:hypothetical protein
MRQYAVSYTNRPNTLDILSEIISAVILLWYILLRAYRRGADTEYVGPPLQRLVVAFGRQRGVHRAIPEF